MTRAGIPWALAREFSRSPYDKHTGRIAKFDNHGAVFARLFSPVIEDQLKESRGFLSFTSETRVTSTKGERQ